MKYSSVALLSLFLLIFSIQANAQVEYKKAKVMMGNAKKNEKVGILYTLHNKSYLFQYGNQGEKGFIDGNGISVIFDREPDKDKLNSAINGIDKWTYSYEFYEGDLQNGVKFGKGKLKDGERIYVGDFENDKPHGFGKIEKYNDRKIVYEYSGYFFKGFPHGPGTLLEQGLLGVNVAHYPNVYNTGMIVNGKPRGLTMIQKKGGKDNLQLDKTTEFNYMGIFMNVRSVSDLINGDTLSFVNLFNTQNALYLNADTIYNGKLNENKKLTGLGYLITSDGTIRCGIFDNGKLNGYGFVFTVATEESKINDYTYTNKTLSQSDGMYVNDKMVNGSLTITKQKIRNTPSAFEDYGGNIGEFLDLEIKKEKEEIIKYYGTFNENELLEGSSCYYDDGTNVRSGNFKNGKLHGEGELKNRTGTYSGRFEEGVFKEGKITYSVTGPMGPPDGAFLIVDGEIGVFSKITGKLLGGKTIKEWEYYKGDTRDFFYYCRTCNGAGIIWGKCTSTYQQYTHLKTRSSNVTYGSRTFVKTWSEPQYKTVAIVSDCSSTCGSCQGKGRSLKPLDEITRIYKSK